MNRSATITPFTGSTGQVTYQPTTSTVRPVRLAIVHSVSARRRLLVTGIGAPFGATRTSRGRGRRDQHQVERAIEVVVADREVDRADDGVAGARPHPVPDEACEARERALHHRRGQQATEAERIPA